MNVIVWGGCAASPAVRDLLVARIRSWAPEARLVCADLEAAAREALRDGGPLLVAAANAPRLSREHADGALGDLADGTAVSYGPGMTGGWYLLGLAMWVPEAFGDDPWRVAAAGHEVALLRMERLVTTADDAAAFLVDPLTPQDVAAVLRMV